MLELFDKAYDLTVNLRRSKKAIFEVRVSNSGAPILEREMAPQFFDDRNGPRPHEAAGSEVVFTVFGGLVRVPVVCQARMERY